MTIPRVREPYDVLVVSDEILASVTVHARSNSDAERRAVKAAERVFQDRRFVSAGASKR